MKNVWKSGKKSSQLNLWQYNASKTWDATHTLVKTWKTERRDKSKEKKRKKKIVIVRHHGKKHSDNKLKRLNEKKIDKNWMFLVIPVRDRNKGECSNENLSAKTNG